MKTSRELKATLKFNQILASIAPVSDFTGAKASDTTKFGTYFRAMLDEGIYLAPSQFEAAFVSLAHTNEDIAATIEAHERTILTLGELSAGSC